MNSIWATQIIKRKHPFNGRASINLLVDFNKIIKEIHPSFSLKIEYIRRRSIRMIFSIVKSSTNDTISEIRSSFRYNFRIHSKVNSTCHDGGSRIVRNKYFIHFLSDRKSTRLNS